MALPVLDLLAARRFAWVNHALIAINVVIFLFLQPPVFQGGEMDTAFDEGSEVVESAVVWIHRYAAIPCEISSFDTLAEKPSGCDANDIVAPVALPQNKSILVSLAASLFLHGGLLHLLGNMFFLWIFGNNVEDRIGSATYLAFYLVAGLVSTLGHVAWDVGSSVPVIGASGAVSGVMGAYVVFHPRAKVLTLIPGWIFPVVYLPSVVVLGLYFASQFFTPEVSRVAWVAHVAGMVAGAGFALIWRSVASLASK